MTRDVADPAVRPEGSWRAEHGNDGAGVLRAAHLWSLGGWLSDKYS